MRLLDFRPYITGSVQPKLNQANLNNIFILLPSDDLLKKYYKVADSIFEFILGNEEESRILAQIRDTLLPKLLSGEIRVKVEEEFDEEIKELEKINKEKIEIQRTLDELFI